MSELVAVIGGTGALGSAIALRLAKAGLDVVIGSRAAARSQEKALELGRGIRGASMADAAKQASIVILAVPFAAQAETIAEIKAYVQGKIVLDTTVPLAPPKVSRVSLPPEGSAAVRAQKLLGDEVIVVSALHNVAAAKLAKDGPVECDVLVFGDDADARTKVACLVESMGLRAVHGGVLANSAAAEAVTSVLIFINRTYKVDGAGVTITGLAAD